MTDKDVKYADEKVEKVEEFAREFHVHGMGCGQKIAEIMKLIHPGALLIVPLYRSCLVVVQNEEEQEEGDCTIHTYADPHWLGGDINIETLKSDEFHFAYKVQGDRQGPSIARI